ncbi:gamma-aminobutyric acid type B receptor subunit 2-like isoform X5 [Oncorhynchus keta]|uniref:gamma-aminobutyric acid type B receptor subunit 2-like isoform X5 n=1 Tax=Oncorhynchus keta TaxID=8018 RepID=UPI00227A89FC|nr:gamma-aminobutyric acid type B receptor subunit 2-like isoform X5 [Oncorhynchus keta]
MPVCLDTRLQGTLMPCGHRLPRRMQGWLVDRDMGAGGRGEVVVAGVRDQEALSDRLIDPESQEKARVVVRHSLPVLWIMPLTDNPGRGNLTASVLPAVQLALDDLSRQQTPLRNYEINFHVIDSECNIAKGLKAYFDAICFGPKYLMIFGGVCPSVTSVIAESLQGWNLVQLSFAATTPVLDDEKKYPNFFRMVTSDNTVNQAVVKILQNYKWRRVGTLTQDVQRISEIRRDLTKQLSKADVMVAVTESLSTDPCINVKKLKDMDVTIIIGLFDENSASKVFCCAYSLNMFGGRYQWILPGGYQGSWWEEADSSNCASNNLLTAMEGYITVDFTHLSNRQIKGISGRTPEEYDETYNRELLQRGLVASKFHGFAYDGVWVMVKALTRVIESVRHRERYDIHRNFTVSSKEIGQMVLDSMKEICFEGVTGQVMFRNGERMGTIKLSQFQEGREVKIGQYNAEAEELELNHLIKFQGMQPPKDRAHSQRWDVSVPLYIILLSTTGLAMLMALFFLFFHIKHHNHWVMKKSSPSMNYLIILGTMLACTSVFLCGLDGSLVTDKVFVLLCPIRTYILSVGYTTTFGALFAKTWRVWTIVKYKEIIEKIIKDDQLWIIVGGMLLIDLCLLTCWQMVDPLRRTVEEFSQELVKIRDNPNQVDPTNWLQCDLNKEDSETSSSSSSLNRGRSLESLRTENQHLRRRITEIGDQLEDVAMQVLEEELSPPSPQGHEVRLRAQVCSEDVPRMNRELFDDINSPEHIQRRRSVQLPILHHAYMPAIGGMSASCSSLLRSPDVPSAQQRHMPPSHRVMVTGL